MIVLATGNPYKIAEIMPLLRKVGIEAKAQTDFFNEEVVEDGLSFVENALKKARYASHKTGLPALADDSGIEVDSLGGKPGIYSARFADISNDKPNDIQNLEKLLQELGNRPFAERQARYSCVVVYVTHADDPMPIIGFGHWYGEILMERRTGQGIGYDDIMWIPKYVKAVSEIPFELKNQISHRAKAVQSVLDQLLKREE